jgi:AcrR family transcriptional regulator
MPRAYNKQEREAIRERLLEVGEQLFARYGLRKTTISEIIRDARIGKGTFYQHFESKEDLFLAIQEKVETELASRRQAALRGLNRDPRRMVRTLFTSAVSALREHPFLQQLMDPELLAELLRKAPPARVRLIEDQNLSHRELFASWVERGVVRGIDADTLYGLLGALFLLEQNREALGGQVDLTEAWIIERICDTTADGAPPSAEGP